MTTKTTPSEIRKHKILEECAAEMSGVIQFSKKHNADPFGALLSVMDKAIDKAFDAGMVEGNCGECES